MRAERLVSGEFAQSANLFRPVPMARVFLFTNVYLTTSSKKIWLPANDDSGQWRTTTRVTHYVPYYVMITVRFVRRNYKIISPMCYSLQ